MKKISFVCLLCFILISIGCASSESTIHEKEMISSSSMDRINRIVQESAIPQIKSSSFINRPTLIVSGQISGSINTGGEIDGLSKMIRESIMMELIKTPGMNIVQRHRLRKDIIPGMIPILVCSSYKEPEYYLVLDLRMGDQECYINLIAIDIETGGTVPGFGITFDVKATDDLKNLYDIKYPDEYLIGTKTLPITGDDKDAVAAYVGYNMICILNDIYMPDGKSIFIDKGNHRAYENDILTFLENYLNVYGLQTSNSKQSATHIVETSVTRTGQAYVLWVKVVDMETNRVVPYTASSVFYKKNTEAPLSFSIIRNQNNISSIVVNCDNRIQAMNFTISENGELIFPNIYSSELLNDQSIQYNSNNNTALLDFTTSGSIAIGGDTSPFNFILIGNGVLKACYSVEDRQFQDTCNYN